MSASVRTEKIKPQVELMATLTSDGKLAVNEATAAEIMGVSAGTLRNWRSNRYGNIGPAYAKVGKRVVYQLDELKAYLDRNTVPAGR